MYVYVCVYIYYKLYIINMLYEFYINSLRYNNTLIRITDNVDKIFFTWINI